MKINGKPIPQWLNIAIALILFSTIKVLWKHYGYKEDKWKPFITVTQKASVNIIADTAERRKWCDCVIATFKKKYPDGLENFVQDTLNVQMATTSYECIHAIRNNNTPH